MAAGPSCPVRASCKNALRPLTRLSGIGIGSKFCLRDFNLWLAIFIDGDTCGGADGGNEQAGLGFAVDPNHSVLEDNLGFRYHRRRLFVQLGGEVGGKLTFGDDQAEVSGLRALR